MTATQHPLIVAGDDDGTISPVVIELRTIITQASDLLDAFNGRRQRYKRLPWRPADFADQFDELVGRVTRARDMARLTIRVEGIGDSVWGSEI